MRASARLPRLATFVLAAALLAGPSGALVAPAAEPFPLTLSLEEDPSSLDTILNTGYGWLLGPLTQGYLFLVDAQGGLVPDRALALPTRANGGISADGRTIRYHIRTGRWSDGAPFDARDVAFTVSALRNPRTNVPDRSTVEQIQTVEAPRPDTLVVRLKAPSAPFVSSFLTLGANDPFSILPRHVAAAYSDLNRSSLDAQPVGLGPFRLSRWIRGERLEFERNPYYWRGPARAPRIDVSIVPSPITRVLLVQTGRLDETYVSGLELARARLAGLPIAGAVTNIVDYLQFNLRRPALRDRAVRVALAQALDRTRLARDVYRGLEVPTPSEAYAPAVARATLAPRSLALDLAIAGTWRSSASAAVQIQAQLARAGVTVTIHSYTPGTFWGPKSDGGILESGRFDMALTSWSPALDPDRSYLFGCAALPPAGGNAGAYCDPAFDAAETAGALTYDESLRRADYRRAQAILEHDLPIVPIGFERSAYALSPRFRGFAPNPMGRDFWNAWELSAATTR
jgi:peptide/nickel transport system substrate-binding protein